MRLHWQQSGRKGRRHPSELSIRFGELFINLKRHLKDDDFKIPLSEIEKI